jgi:polysaccharide deacetylase family protein (PEP-CTERM system associated)
MPDATRQAFTVDVEEWFHVCGAGARLAPDRWSSLPSRVVANTHDLLDLLDRCGVRATFFVLGYVADRHPRLVESILQAGHEVASHGFLHERVYDLTPDAFEQDLDRSVAALRACGAARVDGFRAPEWSINGRSLWALDLLASKGFRFDSSMAPMRIVGDPAYSQALHRRTTASGDIVECPPLVARRFGQQYPLGGGWGLRMSRPTRVLRTLESRGRAGLTSILWVHPWEIDDDPPRVSLPAGAAFAHYFRLSGFRSRLEAILRGMAFGPLGPLVSEAARP